MDLSVVIVNYNVSSFLDQALTTLKDAAQGIDHEVFVVDNASSDDSVSMIKKKHPWVKLIANEENVGFARANNQALRIASGRYMLLLNPDTVLRSDTLKTMLAFHEEHPEAGISGCKVLNPDGTLQLACRRGFPTPGVAFFKMVGLSNIFPKSKTFGAYNLTYLDPDTLTEVDAVSGSFMMIRKEALEKAGLMDEDFFMYGEDLDICYRVQKAGWKVFYVPDTEIIHFKGESTKSLPSLRNINNFYNAMLIFVNKHHTGRRKLMPGWMLSAGIYFMMSWVYIINMVIKARQPLIDLFLLNVSLVLGIFLRFGMQLSLAPNYSQLEWISIFIVYSTLYMATFYFIGMYHRFKNNSERALIGIFIGFLFNVFIVNFIQEYNFSRIASFYCWGFNSILISGWRFIFEIVEHERSIHAGRKTIIIGKISDVVTLRNILRKSESYTYDIVGCVEISQDAIRGTVSDGIHVIGLVTELNEIIKEYAINVVILAGSDIPFSKILNDGKGLGSTRPEFVFVPELKSTDENGDIDSDYITLIDIQSGSMSGRIRR
jgi:O-antigen biosynthesis protein